MRSDLYYFFERNSDRKTEWEGERNLPSVYPPNGCKSRGLGRPRGRKWEVQPGLPRGCPVAYIPGASFAALQQESALEVDHNGQSDIECQYHNLLLCTCGPIKLLSY